MIPYRKFGTVYDQLGHDSFSVAMAEYTMQILARFDCRPTTGLDLCCGSGSAIEWFADHGLQMSGLDNSAAMLRAARAKLKGRGVKLYRQELPRFALPANSSNASRRPSRRMSRRRFDLVTCFFDSLNYLQTERDLQAAFRASYRHLEPGGWLVFDMNTPYMFRSLIDNAEPFSKVRDDIALLVRDRATGRPDTIDFLLTFFVKEGRYWRRFDETHRERAYPTTRIKRWLRETGYQVKGCYRCFDFDAPDRTTKRICIAARRP